MQRRMAEPRPKGLDDKATVVALRVEYANPPSGERKRERGAVGAA